MMILSNTTVANSVDLKDASGNKFQVDFGSTKLRVNKWNFTAGSYISEEFDFSLRFDSFILTFLIITALFHLFVAFVQCGKSSTNGVRWLEYAITSTIMIILLNLTFFVTDILVLILVAVCNVAMITGGYQFEVVNSKKWIEYHKLEGKSDSDASATDQWELWFPYWWGFVPGIAAWAGIILNLIIGTKDNMPWVVWLVFGSYATFFFCFAAVLLFQYSKTCGCLSDQQTADRVYIFLSFSSKSILAWGLFAAQRMTRT
jgi:hypothetical protein